MTIRPGGHRLLSGRDVAQLTGVEVVAAFLQRLGYNADHRAKLTPPAIGPSVEAGQPIRHLERVTEVAAVTHRIVEEVAEWNESTDIGTSFAVVDRGLDPPFQRTGEAQVTRDWQASLQARTPEQECDISNMVQQFAGPC